MSFAVIETTLSADVAASGTFTMGYPTNTDAGFYELAIGHKLWIDQHQMLYDFTDDFTLTFGTSNITVTLGSGMTTAPAGSRVRLQLDRVGVDKAIDAYDDSFNVMGLGAVFLMELGTPDVLDADFFIKAATSSEIPNAETVTYTPATKGTSPLDSAAPTETIGGVLYWKVDQPRNLISTVTHGSSVVAMTITTTGLDVHKQVMVETLTVAATGTSQVDAGTKAFKWIKSIAITAAGNAEANTLNFGTGDILGLPVRLPGVGYVLQELQDGAVASAGTLVAAVDSASTATSGDTRGTYDANSSLNGDLAFKLLVWGDPTDKGVTPFAG